LLRPVFFLTTSGLFFYVTHYTAGGGVPQGFIFRHLFLFIHLFDTCLCSAACSSAVLPFTPKEGFWIPGFRSFSLFKPW